MDRGKTMLGLKKLDAFVDMMGTADSRPITSDSSSPTGVSDLNLVIRGQAERDLFGS